VGTPVTLLLSAAQAGSEANLDKTLEFFYTFGPVFGLLGLRIPLKSTILKG